MIIVVKRGTQKASNRRCCKKNQDRALLSHIVEGREQITSMCKTENHTFYL